ncbi:uncharacterized protein LOC116249623 [Nymphaea colorata]|nr:uncharacterized protein LOC116249623 [Nymphaea colorata]
MGWPKNPTFCLKWPWDSPEMPKKSPGNCEFDVPWLLKPFQVLAGNLPSDLFSGIKLPRGWPVNLHALSKPGRILPEVTAANGRRALTEAEQWEAEQRAFAAALASGKEATVIEFYSRKCRLCNSLLELVMEVEAKNSSWLSLVMLDAENPKWLPELMHYDINYVPCFVLLDKYGKALAKTGVPHSRLHVITGLHRLLQMKQPSTKMGK